MPRGKRKASEMEEEEDTPVDKRARREQKRARIAEERARAAQFEAKRKENLRKRKEAAAAPAAVTKKSAATTKKKTPPPAVTSSRRTSPRATTPNRKSTRVASAKKKKAPKKPPFSSPPPPTRSSRRSTKPPRAVVELRNEQEEEPEEVKSHTTTDDEEEDSKSDSSQVEEKEHLVQEERPVAASDAPANKEKMIWALIPVALVALLATWIAKSFPEGLSVPALAPVSAGKPCFVDSFPPHDADYEPPVPEHCIAKTRKACPEHAVCEDGVIHNCLTTFYESNGYMCVPSAAANATIADMVEQLKVWTAQKFCGELEENMEAIHPADQHPLFHYSRLSGELEQGYDLNLISIANKAKPVFEKDQRGNNVFIGLHSSHKVHIPLTCLVKKSIATAIALAGTVMITGIKTVVGGFMQALYEDPVNTVFILVLCVTILALVRWKAQSAAAQQQLDAEVSKVRRSAVEKLASQPHAKLFSTDLKEELKWELYESDKQGRENLDKVVWPLVVEAMESDGRIALGTGIKNRKRDYSFKWIGGPLSPRPQ